MKVYFIPVLSFLLLGSHTITSSVAQESERCSCEDVINATTQLSVKFQRLSSQYEELSQQIEGQYERLLSSIEETHHDAGTFQNPVTSCRNLPNDTNSGYYWVQSSRTGNPVLVYCDMVRECCGNTGKWMRVGNLDMTDSTQRCPSAFRARSSPIRMCGSRGNGCAATTFSVHGVQYSHVCGRIKGYQFSSTDAFAPYHHHTSRTIDNLYVDGVSLTHGQRPRQHIWTFAAANNEAHSNAYVCPCSKTNTAFTGSVPRFIANDYFCDAGSRIHSSHRYYLNDPLWDGEGCGPASTCCEFNHPPWFCKELPDPTTDDIEMRLCVDETLPGEDVLLEQYEIFIQ